MGAYDFGELFQLHVPRWIDIRGLAKCIKLVLEVEFDGFITPRILRWSINIQPVDVILGVRIIHVILMHCQFRRNWFSRVMINRRGDDTVLLLEGALINLVPRWTQSSSGRVNDGNDFLLNLRHRWFLFLHGEMRRIGLWLIIHNLIS